MGNCLGGGTKKGDAQATKKVRDLEKELRGLENKLSAEQERRKGLERALLPYQLNAVNTEVSGSGGRSRSNTAPAAHIGVPKVPSENALAGEDVGVLAEEIETFRSQLGKDVVNMERELAAFRVEASKTLEAMHKAQVTYDKKYRELSAHLGPLGENAMALKKENDELKTKLEGLEAAAGGGATRVQTFEIETGDEVKK